MSNTQAEVKQVRNQFNFDEYNKMVNPIAAGLKIALAEGLIRDALYTMERFHNPLTDDAQALLGDIKVFRVQYKAQSAARTAKAESPAPMAADGQ